MIVSFYKVWEFQFHIPSVFGMVSFVLLFWAVLFLWQFMLGTFSSVYWHFYIYGEMSKTFAHFLNWAVFLLSYKTRYHGYKTISYGLSEITFADIFPFVACLRFFKCWLLKYKSLF